MNYKIFLKTPSKEWLDGFPIGNGRLGAMVCGDKETDVLSLNHEELWTNYYSDRELTSGFDQSMLDSVRFLLKEGDFFRATAATNAFFSGSGGKSQMPKRTDSFQPAGNLKFKIDNVANFENRELHLDTGFAKILRSTENGTIQSSFFCHLEKGIIIANWQGDISGQLSFSREHDNNTVDQINLNKNGFKYCCSIANGFEYVVASEFDTDGQVKVCGEEISIKDAKYLTIYLNIATQCAGIEEELKKYPLKSHTSFDELLKSHSRKFKSYMDRVDFQLYGNDKSELPIDERLNGIRNGEEDITLPVLYFNYGRYLLLSSSFKSKLPSNLQGIWNIKLKPEWNCDFHFDINLQMYYWMAEPLNMPECSEALFNYAESLIPHGKKVARDLYGCRGVYFPLSGDASYKCTPEAFGWAAWIGAAPWIAQHFWWHYTYTEDIEFLKNRAYPLFKEIAEFYEDYLVADENGIFQIMPSCSPESSFEEAYVLEYSVATCISSAMDVQLAYDCLGYAIKSADILKLNFDECKKWSYMREHLPAFAIGSDGRLLEWNEEKKETEPGHRHLSHLYGLYPSDLFNPIERPEQYRASKKSLDYRIAHDGGCTGWSTAWVMACYARLGETENTISALNRMFAKYSTDSLLSLHPPRIFQIDGNLGIPAAILEAIVQCWGGKVHLLRALPEEWKNGKLCGVKIPGGHTISLSWENARIKELKIEFNKTDKVIVCTPANEELVFSGEKGTFAAIG